MTKCIDVEKRFTRHKVGYEDEFYRQTADPWHKVIKCRGGTIGPYGGDDLLACTKSRGIVATTLVKSGVVEVTQDGDDGINAKFNVKDAVQVFQIMGAKAR